MSSVLLTNFDGLSVAIVDDDPRVRLVLEAALRDLNVTCFIFDNTFDLLRSLEQTSPSCVFLDFILPQMTGLECVRSLRSSIRSQYSCFRHSMILSYESSLSMLVLMISF